MQVAVQPASDPGGALQGVEAGPLGQLWLLLLVLLVVCSCGAWEEP